VITRDEFSSWVWAATRERTSYPEEGVTLADLLENPRVRWEDRLECLWRSDRHAARRLAIWSAGRALRHWTAAHPGDRRPRDLLRAASTALHSGTEEGHRPAYLSVIEADRAAREAAYAAVYAADFECTNSRYVTSALVHAASSSGPAPGISRRSGTTFEHAIERAMGRAATMARRSDVQS
jgi:hypothetical protein